MKLDNIIHDLEFVEYYLGDSIDLQNIVHNALRYLKSIDPGPKFSFGDKVKDVYKNSFHTEGTGIVKKIIREGIPTQVKYRYVVDFNNDYSLQSYTEGVLEKA